MDAGGKKPVIYSVDDIELEDPGDEEEYLVNQGPGESEEESKEKTTETADKTDNKTDKTQTDSTAKDNKD
jgi:hypothetical protein